MSHPGCPIRPTTAALAAGLTGITAVYNAAAPVAETRWPRFGALLGVARIPAYRGDTPSGDAGETRPLP